MKQPIAYMCPHDPERETAFSWKPGMCESSGCGHQRVPVYLRSEPLTESQILELLPDAQHGWTTATYGKWVARAVERAHGINNDATD